MPISFLGGAIVELTTPPWWLSGSAIDLWFANNQYYDSGVVADPTGDLSISRASIGYATTSAGVLTQFATNTLRITDLGLLVEDARTNVVLWNRDLTNAAWTKTNMTAALDQTGADGTANSASSLLATAGNATVLQAITLGSSARFQSVWAKRITGSGTINMTMDNGATWTAITLTSSYTQLTIPTQTLANPTVGFRIVTNGDSIAVDFVQNENGAFASSPIPTTTTSATRAAEVIHFLATAATILETFPFSVYADIKASNQPTASWRVIGNDGDGQTAITLETNNTAIQMYTGFLTSATMGNSLTATAGVKTAAAVSSTDRSIVAGGGTVATDVHGGPTLSVPNIGRSDSATESFYGYVRRVALWTSKLADATLQGFTNP